jgi:hypothetical protein
MVRERRASRRRPAAAKRETAGSIWDKPRIKAMLAQPVGTPVPLTKEEALAIARDSFGRGQGRFPDGIEYVNRVREIWKGLVKPANG